VRDRFWNGRQVVSKWGGSVIRLLPAIALTMPRQRLCRWEKAFSVGGTQALNMVKQRIVRQQIEDRVTLPLIGMDPNTALLMVRGRAINIHGSRFPGCDSGDE
jgi:hypothetical protein